MKLSKIFDATYRKKIEANEQCSFYFYIHTMQVQVSTQAPVFQNVLFEDSLSTPLGNLQIVTNGEALVSLHFSRRDGSFWGSGEYADVVKQQLKEYFEGTRTHFSLNIQPDGTDFQKKIWHLVYDIPFGKTASYKDISQWAENPKAIRAVGTANGANPIPIVIPCHRVVGSDASLTGYSGELWRKKWLLDHESKLAGQQVLFN